MPNQPEFVKTPPEREEKSAPGGMDHPWWKVIGEYLDLGFFFFPGQENLVYLNPVLQGWLGIQVESKLDERAFWKAVSSLAVDPAHVKREKYISQDKHGEKPLVQFSLKTDSGKILTMHLFTLAGAEKLESDYGGFVSRDQETDRQVGDIVQVFNNIFTPTRQLTAAVQANLQALADHLQTWSPEVVDRFLSDAREELGQLRQFLDLGLNYSHVIEHTPLFKQPVSLVGLLEDIISEKGFTTLKVSESQPDDDGPVLAKIDLAKAKIALEAILKEIVDKNPAGQQSEIRISEREGYVVLNLESPRMLPLPGLSAGNSGKGTLGVSPELFLAREILAAQGGDLILGSRPAEEGGGLDIEVSLPVAEAIQLQPIRQEWRELFGGGSGRVLLAEAQTEYQLRIRDALVGLGYRVDIAAEGGTALDLVQTRQPNLVILARNLPGMDGLLVTQGVRRWSAVPIIMISMRDSMDDLLYAYRLGVDDYLQKPFLIEELLAKVQVFISRQEFAQWSIAPEIYQEGSIRIDHRTRQVWVRGQLVRLTPTEYNLLVYLSRQGRQIVPYEQLLEQVWEGPEKGTRQGLFVHVKRLREKIETDPKNPRILSNKWGVGYVFNP